MSWVSPVARGVGLVVEVAVVVVGVVFVKAPCGCCRPSRSAAFLVGGGVNFVLVGGAGGASSAGGGRACFVGGASGSNSQSSSSCTTAVCAKSPSKFFLTLWVSSLLWALSVRPLELALLCCGADIVEALEEAAQPAVAPAMALALASLLFSGVLLPYWVSHSVGALASPTTSCNGMVCVVTRVPQVVLGAGGGAPLRRARCRL